MDYALNAKGFGAWVKCVFAHIFPNPNLHLSSKILNLFKNPKKLWNLPMNFTQTEVGVRNVPITASTFILPVINFITGTWHYKLHWEKLKKMIMADGWPRNIQKLAIQLFFAFVSFSSALVNTHPLTTIPWPHQVDGWKFYGCTFNNKEAQLKYNANFDVCLFARTWVLNTYFLMSQGPSTYFHFPLQSTYFLMIALNMSVLTYLIFNENAENQGT